jgi:hypothetical protein
MTAGTLPIPGGEPAGTSRGAIAANLILIAAGFSLILLAAAAGQSWTHRHFLPIWTWSWPVQLRIVLALRLLVVSAALLLVFIVRPRAVRAIAAGRGRALLFQVISVSLAVVAALVTTEGILRTRTWRSAQEHWNLEEPLRVRNRAYGWGFAPNHSGSVLLGAKMVHYATGPFGYRAPRAGVGPDFARPTIVFAGESVIFGYGLQWAETVPAQAQAMTGIQAANIAVNAHATDQILLRLRGELPRFANPVAVVIPFMSLLLDRNLDRDRPHLDSRLRWHPGGKPPLRLVELVRRGVRYRSSESIAEGVAMTQAALRQMVAMAQARGAKAIVLVPQYLPEQPREREVRRAVLDKAGIPYLFVPLDGAWRNPIHGHPTAEGARAIAAAVAAQLDPPRRPTPAGAAKS